MVRQSIFLIFLLSLFLGCTKVDRITKITTDDIIVANTSVNAEGTIIDIAKGGIESYGHCWSRSINPTINDFLTSKEQADLGLNFFSELDGLDFGVTYYVRSYAVSGNEIFYGEEKSFTISDFSTISVSCSSPVIIDESSVTVTSEIVGVNALSVLDYGFCWSQNTYPSINDFTDSKGNLTNDLSHSSIITGLTQGTGYYIRAYAKLDNSTVIYSDQEYVKITNLELTTNNFFITGNSALLTGSIIGLGVLPLTDHGHCWSVTTSNPSINDNVNSLGPASTIGVFDSEITGLSSGVTYYYASYAIKSDNTITYGGINWFTF